MAKNSLTKQFKLRIARVLILFCFSPPPSFLIPLSIVINSCYSWNICPHSSHICMPVMSLFRPHSHGFFWLIQSAYSSSPCLFHAEGRLEVNMSEVSLEDVERSLLEKDPSISIGGYWKPKDCLPRWKVSVDETLLKKDCSLWNTQTDEGGTHIMQMLPCRAWGFNMKMI